MTENFNNFFKDYCLSNLKKKLHFSKKIYEICSYMFQINGKFFRPYLMLKTTEFLNQDKEIILPFAFSVELIHNYSLIHDDLPSMDNEEQRRGFPTLHKKFGEAEAILAGDMLLTLAFEVITNNKNHREIPFFENKLIQITKKISQYSSYRYLVTGQFLDIWLQKKLIDSNLENIKWINFYKTAGLILLSIEIPIILFDPPYKIKYTLIKYGYYLSTLFQLTDDILDKDGLCNFLDEKYLRNHVEELTNKIKKLEISEELKDIAEFLHKRINI